MDVVVEGKINKDESMRDLIQTVLELKNVANPVLRITDEESELQGRIAFSQGGYIIGGRVNNTDELGYDAVRRLLSIRNGNFAVLDPGRNQFNDVNQTLWLLASRVIDALPNLPESPDSLIEAGSEKFGASARPAATASNAGNAQVTPITSVKSKSRKFNKSSWYMLQLFFIAVLALGIGGGVLLYHEQIWSFFKTSLHL